MKRSKVKAGRDREAVGDEIGGGAVEEEVAGEMVVSGG